MSNTEHTFLLLRIPLTLAITLCLAYTPTAAAA
jgi:hypothetical protein